MRRKMSISALVAAASCLGVGAGCAEQTASNARTDHLRNVDVTVIYPLPRNPDELAAMVSAGTLLGDTPLPELDVRYALSSQAERHASLRVTALRIDPCGSNATARCVPQLRLVLQSLREAGGAYEARDGAMHAFYDLSEDAFASLLAELRSMRAAHADEPAVPLGVHPWLSREGLAGPHAMRWRALIATHATELVRVTHFSQTGADPLLSWTFGITDKGAGQWQTSVIPTTEVTSQVLTTFSGGRWDADIEPPVTTADDVTRVFKVPLPEEAAAARAIPRVLNPRIHTAESIDCATCHIAPDVAIFLRETRGYDLAADPSHFTSSYPLEAATHAAAEAVAFQNIHMLSYTGTRLNVTARVAHETAVVLELVNDAQ